VTLFDDISDNWDRVAAARRPRRSLNPQRIWTSGYSWLCPLTARGLQPQVHGRSLCAREAICCSPGLSFTVPRKRRRLAT